MSDHYDVRTIRLHWIIVLLIAVQWIGAELIDFIPGRPAHALYWSVHIVLGVATAFVLAIHVWWRWTKGSKLPPSNEEGLKTVTAVVHGLLFALPVAIVALGVGIILARGWNLFGVLAIPSVPGGSKPLAEKIHGVHEWTAHVVMLLAVGHAGAALIHHYALRDGVLVRMAPWLAQRSAKTLS